jgi:hypothetical protein
MTRSKPPESRPDDDEVHASSLGLLCEGAEAPQPYDIEARLNAEGLDMRDMPDGPNAEGEDVVWSRAFYSQALDSPWLVFCARRDEEFTPWEWSPARWRDEEEFAAARRSRWLLGVETIYDPDEDAACAYHNHLRVAAALGDGLAVACADMQSLSLRSMTTLRQLADCEVEPAPDELYQIHAVTDDNGHCWMHTHGLRRFDLPELDLLRVPNAQSDTAATILQWLVGMLLEEHIPNRGRVVEFGEGLKSSLVPLERVLKRLKPDELGGAREREAPDHAGWRMAVVDAGRGGTARVAPARLLEAAARNAVYWSSSLESERRARLARARFGHAAAAYYSTQFAHKHMSVKIGIPADERGRNHEHLLDAAHLPRGIHREHMWFTVQRIEGGTVEGVLENRPVYARWMSAGKVYRLPLTQLSGFQLVLDGQVYDPVTIAELDLVTLHTGKPLRPEEPGPAGR